MSCFFALFAFFPLPVAGLLWNLFNWACFVAILCYGARLLGVSLSGMVFKWKSLKIIDKLLFLAMPLALLLDNLTMAQVNIWVVFLCLLTLWLAQEEKDWRAGLVLSLAFLMKMTPLLFCLYFAVKKRGRILLGFFLGCLLLTAALPTAILGFETNRLYHRQWLGRTVKPILVKLAPSLVRETRHPLKKNLEIMEYDQLTGRLVEKNQSLDAVMTRLFLQDRNERAAYPLPIYAARKYEKLPVLFGGLPPQLLNLFIRGLQGGIVLLLILAWRHRSFRPPSREALEWGLAFLSMTLLAPWVRSHQFMAWIFPLMVLFQIQNHFWTKQGTRFACLLYLAQALPYGKAIGFGGWANLVFWGLFWFALVFPRGAKVESI